MLGRLFGSYMPSWESTDLADEVHSRTLLYPDMPSQSDPVKLRLFVVKEGASAHHQPVCFDSNGEGLVETPKSDLLGEIIFGTVPLTYKGPSMKLHRLRRRQDEISLLVSRLFPVPVREGDSGSSTPLTIPSERSSLGSSDGFPFPALTPLTSNKSSESTLPFMGMLDKKKPTKLRMYAVALAISAPDSFNISRHWKLCCDALRYLSLQLTDILATKSILQDDQEVAWMVDECLQRLGALSLPFARCGMRWPLWINEVKAFIEVSEEQARFIYTLFTFVLHQPESMLTSLTHRIVIICRCPLIARRLVFLIASLIRNRSLTLHETSRGPGPLGLRKKSSTRLLRFSNGAKGWDIPTRQPSSFFDRSRALSSTSFLDRSVTTESNASQNSQSSEFIVRQQLRRSISSSWWSSFWSGSGSTLQSDLDAKSPTTCEERNGDAEGGMDVRFADDGAVDVDFPLELTPSKTECLLNPVLGFTERFYPDFIIQANPQHAMESYNSSLEMFAQDHGPCSIVVANAQNFAIMQHAWDKSYTVRLLSTIDKSLSTAIERDISFHDDSFAHWLQDHGRNL